MRGSERVARRLWRIGALALPVVVTSVSGCGNRDSVDGSAVVEVDSASVRVLGTSDALADVRDVDVLNDGSVWVVNSIEPYLIGFPPSGDSVIAYGRRGGGPDEFGAPAGFVFGATGVSAWVLDVGRNVLVEVPTPSTGRSELALPGDSVPLGSIQPGMGLMSEHVRSARIDGTTLVPRSLGSLSSGVWSFWSTIWGASLVGVDSTGANASTVLSLAEELGDPPSYLQQTNGFPPVPLWFRLWTVCSDTTIHIYDRMNNAVRTYTPDGTEIDRIGLPEPRFDAVSDQEFARATFGLAAAEATGGTGVNLAPQDSAEVMQRLVQAVEGAPERLGTFMPRYVDLRCGDDGGLWLQPIDLARSNLRGGADWIRVTSDGTARTYRMPPRFYPYRFIDGRVLGVQRDQFDVASVAWAELPPS